MPGDDRQPPPLRPVWGTRSMEAVPGAGAGGGAGRRPRRWSSGRCGYPGAEVLPCQHRGALAPGPGGGTMAGYVARAGPRRASAARSYLRLLLPPGADLGTGVVAVDDRAPTGGWCMATTLCAAPRHARAAERPRPCPPPVRRRPPTGTRRAPTLADLRGRGARTTRCSHTTVLSWTPPAPPGRRRPGRRCGAGRGRRLRGGGAAPRGAGEAERLSRRGRPEALDVAAGDTRGRGRGPRSSRAARRCGRGTRASPRGAPRGTRAAGWSSSRSPRGRSTVSQSTNAAMARGGGVVVGGDLLVGHARPGRAARPPRPRCGPCRRRSGTASGRRRPTSSTMRAMRRGSPLARACRRSGRAGSRPRRSVATRSSSDHMRSQDRQVVPVDRVAPPPGSGRRARSRPAVRRSMTVRSPSARAFSRSAPARRCTPSARKSWPRRVVRPSRWAARRGRGR